MADKANATEETVRMTKVEPKLTARRVSLVMGMAAAVLLTAGALIAATARADTVPASSQPAPAFEGLTSTGETVALADFAGKTVVLEWTNDGCPFVQKHYAQPPANMQGMQNDAIGDDIIWLSIISSAPGKQGHVSGEEADALTESRDAAPAHIILDEDGSIGRLYSAKTTPHMFVITPEGAIAYQGAIDDVRSANVADIEGARNHVTEALADMAVGEPVEVASTKPYGCSVKYN